MMKGLVMEGGAMRGMFTAGVIDVFMDNGITFDGAIGVSAGATFGCNIKSAQPGRALRYNKRFMKDRRYCSISSLIRTGDLFNVDFCYNVLPNELDPFDYEVFAKNPIKFYVVASDCLTGEPVYKELKNCRGSEMKWMQASASMPLCSRVVEVDGYKLLDGGMTDSIPLKAFENMGYNKNVVVLTQPKDFVKKPNKMIGLMKLFLGKYPKLLKAMEERHIVYNEETKYVNQKALSGEVIVIQPAESLGIGRLEKNPDELERCYQEGRRAALEKLDTVRAFLAG
ncbi:MAG: patatin family protein [Treponema sp.]|nr:patatin family protein [Treponema sp.]